MKKSTLIFSAANLLGMVLYFSFVASICQQARMEERNYYDFGDSLNFVMTALPVLILCVLLDVIWAIMALVAIYRRRDHQSAVACVVVAAVWTLTILLTRQIK